METGKTSEISLTQQLLYALRYYLGGRRGLIAVGLLAIGIGVVLNWRWFVAAGIAPVILALLPCAAMCALGLCMNKLGGKSCSTQANNADHSVSKASAVSNTDEPQSLSSEISRAVEPSSSGTDATVPAGSSDAVERRVSVNLNVNTKEK